VRASVRPGVRPVSNQVYDKLMDGILPNFGDDVVEGTDELIRF